MSPDKREAGGSRNSLEDCFRLPRGRKEGRVLGRGVTLGASSSVSDPGRRQREEGVLLCIFSPCPETRSISSSRREGREGGRGGREGGEGGREGGREGREVGKEGREGGYGLWTILGPSPSIGAYMTLCITLHSRPVEISQLDSQLWSTVGLFTHPVL